MCNNIFVTRASLPPIEEYIEMIKPLWDTHQITNMGCYHKKLEKELREFFGIDYVSLMVNGHSALEMAIQSMDFPKGGEIITTPFTFISTTHAIVRNNLVPVFCDIKLDDYTIDETKIESLITEKTVGLLPVHVYGNICNIEEIEKIAFKYNLKVIYDSAHAFGELYNKKSVAEFGDASVFSFHATKVYNSIEGGCVTFNNKELYEKLYNLKNFGIRGEELVVSIGANAKMNEFVAAMGLCNLKYIIHNIAERKKKVKVYIENLIDEEYIVLPKYKEDEIEYNYAYFPIRFKENKIRDSVYEMLKSKNIYSRKYFYPLTSDEACFKNKYAMVSLKNARSVSQSILVLPLYPELEENIIIKICEIIKSVCRKFSKNNLD